MNVMKKIASFLIILVSFYYAGAQTVTNSRFEQEGKMVKIYYDLSEEADVSIYLSTDGGKTYESQPIGHVTGAVGEGVSAGKGKCAVWDVLSDRDRIQGDARCFKVETSPILKKIVVNGVEFKMIYVSGGTFVMGCEEGGDSYCDDLDLPAHSVTVRGYYIGETEVTQALWEAVMGSKPTIRGGWTASDGKGDNFPAYRVSYSEVCAFISKLNRLTGQYFRLPSEAEWEYAARGGKRSKGYLYSGSNDLDEVAWNWRNSGDIYLTGEWDSETNQRNRCRNHEVKTKKPNELGIYDMSGNVLEMTAEAFYYYSKDYQVNPVYPKPDGNKTILMSRGGNHYNGEKGCIVYNRDTEIVGEKEWPSSLIGFRLALEKEKRRVTEESRTINVNGVNLTMVHVEGGTFTMGATSEHEKYANDNEKPAHRVTLDDYWIGETEVTQALWLAVMDSLPLLDGHGVPPMNDSLPVLQVWYNIAQEFIRKLNIVTGLTFRLPTEAEWEYAARGGKKSKGYLYSGSNNIDEVAWISLSDGTMATANNARPVKQKKPNELGIYDMTGNVSELCGDLYGPYSSEDQTNPTGPIKGYEYIKRGGDWSDQYDTWCRVSARMVHTVRGDALGLRLVLVD